jgi:flagellar biosynthesis protein FlhG
MSPRSQVRKELTALEPVGPPSEPLRRPRVRTIAIVSGKGGVGKTTLLVNLAVALADEGQRVLLVDGDWGMGNVDVLLGLNPAATLHDVMRGERSVEEVLLHASERLQVLPCASGVEEMANLDELRAERLLCSLSSLEESCDLILLDTASGIGRLTTHLARAADEILVVTTPEPTAILDAYASLKVLHRQARGTTPWIVVNQARSAAQARAVAERVTAVSRRALCWEPAYLGYVPFSEEATTSILRQAPFVRLFPDSATTAATRDLATRLIAAPGSEPLRTDEPRERVVNLEDARA